jgi:small-conductance mechanosensitive channel
MPGTTEGTKRNLGLGDSTLNFILRVYMPSRDVYLQLRHELHAAISREFKHAGIEIAFPQRDIHIRSAELPTCVAEQSCQTGGTKSSPGSPKAVLNNRAPMSDSIEHIDPDGDL